MLNFMLLSSLSNCYQCVGVYLFFVFHGLFSSLYIATFWACIKYATVLYDRIVVAKNMTTTAFGLAFCIQDFLIFFGPIFTGLVIDKNSSPARGYFWVRVRS